MPRQALTDQDIESFRTNAVHEATMLFAEHGYDGLTMRGLAKAMGCSPMKAYRYFENRDEVFAQVRLDAFKRFADEQAAAYAQGQDPRDTLLRLKEAYIKFATREPHAYAIMFQLTPVPQDYPGLNEESFRGFSYLLKATKAAVAAGIFEGDALTIAHLLWSNTHGLVTLHLSGRLIVGRDLDALASVVLEAPTLKETHS